MVRSMYIQLKIMAGATDADRGTWNDMKRLHCAQLQAQPALFGGGDNWLEEFKDLAV